MLGRDEAGALGAPASEKAGHAYPVQLTTEHPGVPFRPVGFTTDSGTVSQV